VTSTDRADIVVVGAGMAGLCASLAALEAGARVITVEKGNRFGGSMWLSNGLIWTFRDKDELHERVPGGNPALQDLVVEGMSEGLEWLESQGVELQPETNTQGWGRGRGSTPHDMTAALAEKVRVLGGELRLETSLRELRVQDGAVAGARLDGPDGGYDLDTGAVVLASGGFQGNPELLARYVTPWTDRLYLRGNPWSTGDGLLAATAVGAAVTSNLGEFYGHSLAAPPTRFNQQEFMEVGQRYGPLAVAINLDGRRFTDESGGTGEEHLNQRIAQQREATAVYIVDANSAEIGEGFALASVQIERLRGRDGPVVQSDTLEGLCDAMVAWGVDADAGLATLREYNSGITEDRRLYPPRRANRYPVATPPFHAVLVRPGITFTTGGLQVDTEMRVLRRSASATNLPLAVAEPSELALRSIPGLFAIGCDAGGFSAHGYMGGLSTALVTGLIAGRLAATRN
jgi:succinate dehydrogenase/fumarate reductase flavoprotein subunit